jgi:two-component system sensor histidine kinase DesK
VTDVATDPPGPSRRSVDRSRTGPDVADRPGSDELVRRHVRTAQAVSTALIAALPVLAIAAERPPAGIAVALVAGLVTFLVLHLAVLRRSWQLPIEDPPHAGLVLALVAVAVATAQIGFTQGTIGYAWIVLPGAAASDAILARPHQQARWWTYGTAAATAAGVGVGLGGVTGAPPVTEGWRPALVAAAVVLLIAYLESGGLWLWRQTVELEEHRRNAVELAATRERLRLSEDLHDVLGRTLEVVSLKTELADRVLVTDPDRARSELHEVQRLARSSVEDVRALVRENRPTQLAREVEAARRLLTSAGVEVEVPTTLEVASPTVDDLLGRVVREAVTNLLRHADAARCAITLAEEGGGWRLRVTNDGVTAAGGADGRAPTSGPAEGTRGDGTGLRALRERLAAHDGDLTTSVDAGWFRVDVRVPRTPRRPDRDG